MQTAFGREKHTGKRVGRIARSNEHYEVPFFALSDLSNQRDLGQEADNAKGGS